MQQIFKNQKNICVIQPNNLFNATKDGLFGYDLIKSTKFC